MFDGDKGKLSFVDRARMDLAKRLGGEELLYAMLMYIWSPTTAPGAVIANPHTDRVRVIVVSGQSGDAGQWRSPRRAIVQDYKKGLSRIARTHHRLRAVDRYRQHRYSDTRLVRGHRVSAWALIMQSRSAGLFRRCYVTDCQRVFLFDAESKKPSSVPRVDLCRFKSAGCNGTAAGNRQQATGNRQA
ncbi:DUF3047 domain-containing protein [Paraburkholderia caledonica]